MIHLIAAVGRQGQLGLDGKLPWRCPEDLKWFKQMTLGRVVVVGHNTAQTLPRLPGRLVHVMRRGETPEHVMAEYVEDLWIIGGAKTYAKWLPYIDRYHINVIDYDGPADTFMPPLFDGHLQMLLNKHGICRDCGELYEHSYDEPFASCGCNTSEWYNYTPHMKAGVEAEERRMRAAKYNQRLNDSETSPTGEDYNALLDILFGKAECSPA